VVLIGLAAARSGCCSDGRPRRIRALYGSDFDRGAYERLTEIDPVVVS